MAEWCEKHLEDERGREVGMTFGAMLKVYGRLATLPSSLSGDERAANEQELSAKAGELLKELVARFGGASGGFTTFLKPVEPTTMHTNMTYDTGPHPPQSGDVRRGRPIPTPKNADDLAQPRFEIVQRDMGGWVRVFLGHGEPTGEVAKFLSHSLTGWFRKRPHLRLRFAVPVTREGDTAELHAWYDQVSFPDISPMAHPNPDE